MTTPVETFFEKRRGVCQDFSTSRSPACAPWDFRRVMSAVTCARSPAAVRALWALTPPTPGVPPGAPALPGSSLTPPTTASPPMATSPWLGEGIQRRQPHPRSSARWRKTQPESRSRCDAPGVSLPDAKLGVTRLKKAAWRECAIGELIVKLKALLLGFTLSALSCYAADPK